MDACLCRGPVARAFDLHQAVRPKHLKQAFMIVQRLSRGHFWCHMPQGADELGLPNPATSPGREPAYRKIYSRLMLLHLPIFSFVLLLCTDSSIFSEATWPVSRCHNAHAGVQVYRNDYNTVISVLNQDVDVNAVDSESGWCVC
jgi:hypothetical protein